MLIAYLEVPLESYGATKTQYLNALSLFLNQLEFQPSMSVKSCFPELEDHLFLWVDTMRHLKVDTS